MECRLKECKHHIQKVSAKTRTLGGADASSQPIIVEGVLLKSKIRSKTDTYLQLFSAPPGVRVFAATFSSFCSCKFSLTNCLHFVAMTLGVRQFITDVCFA